MGNDKFDRSIFPAHTVENYFEKNLIEIEKLYSEFSKAPDNYSLYFLSEEEFGRILRNPKKVQEAPAHIINEVYFRIQFFFFTNLFKFLKYIESIIASWNSKNYLGWVLFGRAAIELCAVYNHFYIKLKECNLIRTDFTIEEIQKIEDILIQYSHGTRFDWNALIAGDVDKLKDKFEAKGEFRQATNILTTIDRLSKLRPAFHDLPAVYNLLSDYAHPNMGSHSLFIDLPDKVQEPIMNRLALNVNSRRGEFIIVTTIQGITISLVYVAHLLQETANILQLWGGFTESKIFTIKFPNTIAVLKLK